MKTAIKQTLLATVLILGIIAMFAPSKVQKAHYKLGKERPKTFQQMQWESFIQRSKTMIRDSQMVFFGDSRIAGLSVESRYNAVNFGISGETTSNALKMIDQVHNLKGKKIIFAYGINDCYDEEDVECYLDLTMNIDVLLNRYENAYFLSVIPGVIKRGYFESVNANLKHRHPKRFINVMMPKRGYRPDGIHFNEIGNDIIFEYIDRHFGIKRPEPENTLISISTDYRPIYAKRDTNNIIKNNKIETP